MNAARVWTHSESPEGKPTASTYRLGCRCADCYEANKAYQRAYRNRKVLAIKENNTTEYHSHVGQPSKRTAVKWKCIHPHCLKLAGLEMTPEGLVVDSVSGKIDLRFPAATAA